MNTTNNHYNLAGINILQINLQRSKAASSLTYKIAIDKNINLITIQAPFKVDNKIAFFGNNLILPNSLKDLEIKTGIVVLNKNLDVMLLSQFCSRFLTTAYVKSNTLDFYLISVYVSPTDDLNSALAELGSIVGSLGDVPICICGDFNAKSHIWASPVEDNRGRDVVDFMFQFDFSSINDSSHSPFSTVNGESWINLCLANSQIIRLRPVRSTQTDDKISDHHFIDTIKGNSTILFLKIRR